MEDNTWIVLKGEIEEFLEKGEVDPHIKTIVELNLRVGEVEPSRREMAYESIKPMLRNMKGTPVKRGKTSKIPVDARVVIEKLVESAYEASIDYFVSNEFMPLLLRKNAKAGGGLYESPEAYADNVRVRLRKNLMKKYRDGVWDGTVEDLHN